MAWKKLGMIFDLAQHKIGWLRSHAMLPSPLVLDDRIRVYFTGRDDKGQSRISFVDLKADDPTQIVYVHDKPLLDVGKLGAFDDNGMLGTCAVKHKDEVYLYYNGYNRKVTVPYHNAIGVLCSHDGGLTFERCYDGPIIDRNHNEPYFTVAANVMKDSHGWHMWYTSATAWIMVNGKPESLYVVKYAKSDDGFSWHRDNITCIQPLSSEEANVRAAVIKNGNTYKMWFCYRGSQDFRDGVDGYRIGYAESSDPVHWVRADANAGISLSSDGWDSKMQAYPAVVTVGEKTYLFYNGNGFGKDGFGCAVWEGAL